MSETTEATLIVAEMLDGLLRQARVSSGYFGKEIERVAAEHGLNLDDEEVNAIRETLWDGITMVADAWERKEERAQ